MPSLESRLLALERAEPETGALPYVVPDETPDSEINRLRALGREVCRSSDAPDAFV